MKKYDVPSYTPEQELECFIRYNCWTKEDLEEAKKMLNDAESLPKSFYADKPKYVYEVQMRELKLLIKCIKYHEERLNNETQST